MNNKQNFNDYKQSCIKMVIECYDEPIDECDMAQELLQCTDYNELADVMIRYEMWETADAIENSVHVELA